MIIGKGQQNAASTVELSCSCDQPSSTIDQYNHYLWAVGDGTTQFDLSVLLSWFTISSQWLTITSTDHMAIIILLAIMIFNLRSYYHW